MSEGGTWRRRIAYSLHRVLTINAHHSPRIVEFAAIVWSREYGDELPPGEELVPVLHDLVRAANEVEVVAPQKLRHHVLAKRKAHAAVILPPADDVLVGVGPQQVAQKPRVGNIRRPHDALDLLHVLQLGAEAAVHAENLLVDDGGHGQAVEAVGERFPQLDVVAPFALVVKACSARKRGRWESEAKKRDMSVEKE